MGNATSIETAVQHYLDAVKSHLSGIPLERQKALLRELREHIHEAINARTPGRTATLQDAYATLSEMDSPEAYADAAPSVSDEEEPRMRICTNKKLAALVLICSGLQIAGLGVTVAGIPVLGAIPGFAAIVNFFLVWSDKRSPKWLVRLAAVAATCGLGQIVIELARAL